MPHPLTLIAGLLSAALVFVVVAIAWHGVSSTRNELWQDALLLPWALATAVLWHPGLLRGLAASRAGDSFLTLSGGGRAGLVAIVVVAGLALFAASAVKTRVLRRAFARRAALAPAAADLVATTALALVALAIAPQLFYAWYRQLIPGLPAQLVVEGLPSVDRLGELAFPAASGSLAAHAAALFLWTLVLAALLGWLLAVRRRRRSLGALQAGAAAGALAALWNGLSLVLA